MSEQRKTTGFHIFDNYIVYYGNSKTHHRSIENLSISKFADVVLRWSNYTDYLLRTEQMVLVKRDDYDGIPLDFHYIYYGAKNHYTYSDNPSIRINFESTSGDNYDYVALVRKSRTSKWRRPSDPVDVKFKVSSVTIKRKEGDADVWIQGELIRLQKILDNLDKATQSLHLWAENGLNMRVFCASYSCRALNPAIIPNNQLLAHANNGLSLDDLKRRLKCKICGAHCSHVQAA